MRRYQFRYAALAALLAGVPPLSSDAGSVYFTDGQTHTIDADNSYPSDSVFVWSEGIAVITRLNVVNGGEIGTLTGGNLTLEDDSILTMTGGAVGGAVVLAEDAQATIFGGSAKEIQAENQARAVVWGVTSDIIAAHGGPSMPETWMHRSRSRVMVGIWSCEVDRTRKVCGCILFRPRQSMAEPTVATLTRAAATILSSSSNWAVFGSTGTDSTTRTERSRISLEI